MKFSTEGRNVLAAESPFERICELLEPFAPAEAARPLVKYARHEDRHFRRHAAITLGNVGAVACVTPMLALLDDEDDVVRSFAITGIRRGIDSQHCEKDFLDSVFPAITSLLDRDAEAPDVLLAIDAERAMRELLSPKFLTIHCDHLQNVLKALNESEQKLPRAKLMNLLEQLKPLGRAYPYNYAYAEALLAYARNPDPVAETTFRAELRAGDKTVQAAAARALALLAGIPDATQFVLASKRERGFDALSEAQRLYYAAYGYLAQVANGGHAQYFVNASGDEWKTVVRALAAVGATEHATILQEAILLFGPAGPSDILETRQKQLASFSKKKDSELTALDNRYYECPDKLEGLLLLFAIVNKEHFVAPRQE
jgi:HEAT repeat protein